MRQEHAAGDKVFVDYSGKKIPIVDRKTGEDPGGGDLRGGGWVRPATPLPRPPGRKRSPTGLARMSGCFVFFTALPNSSSPTI